MRAFTEQAPEYALEIRKEGMQSASRWFLSEQPKAIAIFFFGSSLYAAYPPDIDLFVIGRPEFDWSLTEIDSLFVIQFRRLAAQKQIVLSPPDTFALIKTNQAAHFADVVGLYPFSTLAKDSPYLWVDMVHSETGSSFLSIVGNNHT